MMRVLVCGLLSVFAATSNAKSPPPPPPPAPPTVEVSPIDAKLEPTAYDYGVFVGMMDRCAARAPMLAAQLPAATAGWERGYPAERIAALRDGAEAKQVAEGRARAARIEVDAKDAVVGGATVPVFPFACAAAISEFASLGPQKMSGSRVRRSFSDTALEIAGPFVLAKLDCARLDAIDVSHPEDAGDAVGDIAETWTFRACGRSLDLSFRWIDDKGAVHMREDIVALYRSLLPQPAP